MKTALSPKATILQAHIPTKIALAKYLIQRGFSLVLHSDKMSDELKELSQLPQIQLRFCRVDVINAPLELTS